MDKPLVILHGEIATLPLSVDARRWAGFLLRKLQKKLVVTMPDSRPMPSIGARCHELRIKDLQQHLNWRIIYRLDEDAILVVDVFEKKTQKTPKKMIDRCKERLREYDRSSGS